MFSHFSAPARKTSMPNQMGQRGPAVGFLYVANEAIPTRAATPNCPVGYKWSTVTRTCVKK